MIAHSCNGLPSSYFKKKIWEERLLRTKAKSVYMMTPLGKNETKKRLYICYLCVYA